MDTITIYTIQSGMKDAYLVVVNIIEVAKMKRDLQFIGVSSSDRIAVEQEEIYAAAISHRYPQVLERHVPYPAKDIARVKATPVNTIIRRVT